VTALSLPAPPVVLAAPSGVGKTTIARTLVEREEDFVFSVSATTRDPRRGEVDGVDYWFLTSGEFQKMIRNGEFAEWAVVHGDFYGTPLDGRQEAARAGRHVLLDIDVQGARQIHATVPDALLLFILPPSVDALLDRLSGRGTEDESSLRRRLKTALKELDAAGEFDFFVLNDDLERAVSEVRERVRSGGDRPREASASLDRARKLKRDIEGLLQRDRLLD